MNQPLVLLIETHRSRRPTMTVRDLYKLLYQGVRGPEHLLASTDIFMQRLEQEWQSLDAFEDDPLYEAVRPDGRLLRVNLRPFKAAGGQLGWLASACLEAGQHTWGTQADLQHAWEAFLALRKSGHFVSLPLEECQVFTAWLSDHDFPAIHHSEPYRRLYRPSYRLISAPISSDAFRFSDQG